jgi:type IV pilus assembly protein PilA
MLNKLKELRNGGEEEGFTLIELMIVVVIIGILAAIAIPIFANQQKSAIDAGVKSDVKNTNTNVATYLTKSPTAGDLGAIQAGSAAATGNAKDLFKIVVTDSATTVTVAGKWDAYTVNGKNTGTGNQVTYTSATGKIVEAAIPAAPVTP